MTTTAVRERLTPRQQEMVDLLAEGLTVNQIAFRIDRSPSTVRNHLHRVYTCLGVHDRAQAVLHAANGRGSGYRISEDRDLYQAIRVALEGIADHLRARRRDRLTSRQHGFLDAFDRVLCARSECAAVAARARMTDSLMDLSAEAGIRPREDCERGELLELLVEHLA